MEVRPPNDAELEAVAEVHVAAAEAGGARAYDPETVAAWAKRDERSPDDYPVDDPASHFVVAVTGDGEVAGFGELVPDEREIRAVYVHPDHERRGVGSALLAHLEGYARALDCGELTLQSSLNAVAFYERAGWRRTGTGESPGGIEVVELRKQL
jgi:putative acetyltransferase